MNAVVFCMGKSSPSQSALDKIVSPIIGLLWLSILSIHSCFLHVISCIIKSTLTWRLKHCSNLIPQMEE